MTPHAGEHGVERCIAVGQLHGVAGGEGDVKSLGGGALASVLEQRLEVVDRAYHAAAAGRDIATLPVPLATSSTLSPARRLAESTSCSAIGSIPAPIGGQSRPTNVGHRRSVSGPSWAATLLISCPSSASLAHMPEREECVSRQPLGVA
jgi:hypothetical protein